MPNPNILFQNIPSATPLEAFQGALQGAAALNQFQQQPMQNRLLQAQTEGAEMRNQAMGQQMDQEYAKFALQDLATDWGSIKPLIAKGDMQNANVAIAQRIDKILKRNGDPSDTIELRDRLNSGLITPEQAIAEVDGALEGARQAGLLGGGGNSALRQQEIDLRRQAMEQEGQRFTQTMDLQNRRLEQEAKALGLQRDRLDYTYDPEVKRGLAEAGAAGSATGKKETERKSQLEDWNAFQSSFAQAYPDIGSILKAAPGSSISRVVSEYGAKIAGGNNLNEAQAEIEQLGAILLQQVPFPPGAQSEAEQRARALTLGRLEDPNISPAKKLEMINRFLTINEQKFKALAPKGDEPAGSGQVIEVDF